MSFSHPTASSSTSTVTPGDDHKPIFLNKGTFGAVFYHPSHPTVYKEVFNVYGDSNLFAEFTQYAELHSAIGCPSGVGVFWTPKPYAYWRPATCEVIHLDPQNAATRKGYVWASFKRTAFSFDLIPSAPLPIIQTYISLFVAPEARSSMPSVRLFRLYFGRENLPAQTVAFNHKLFSDPPLDLRRYHAIRDALGDDSLPPAADVARGMGQLLATLHWQVGVNARDAELVLGSIGGLPHCYVLDFNQSQRWLPPNPMSQIDTLAPAGQYADGNLSAGARRLATLIAGQELYYPRPHQAEVYPSFKAGYLQHLSTVLGGVQGTQGAKDRVSSAAAAFFQEFEEIDERKEARRAKVQSKMVLSL